MKFRMLFLICFAFLLLSCDNNEECYCNNGCNDVEEIEIPAEIIGSCLFLIDDQGYNDVRYCQSYGQEFEYYKAYMKNGYLVLAPNGYIKRIDGSPLMSLSIGIAEELNFYKCDEEGHLISPEVLISYEEKTPYSVSYNFNYDENFMIRNDSLNHIGISTFIVNNDN